MSFSKRLGKNTPQCYTKPLDSLKNWNNHFFWVDERVFLTVVDWRTNASKDGMSANGTYSVEDVRALDTHRTPIQKQPEMLLCMVRISRRYYLGDEVYPTFHHDDDQGGLGAAPCPHEVPLLTLTATRVIEMDESVVATNSSGVPSTIERSPLDFAHEAEASDRGTAAPKMPSPEDVPTTTAPGADQAVETVAAEPPAAQESRKRGHDGTDANAPPKSLRRDHTDLRPSATPIHWLLLTLRHPHPADVAQSSQGVAAAGDPKYENVSSPAEVGSPRSVYRPEWGVTNGSLLDTPEACQDLVDHAAPLGYFYELRHMHNEDFLRQYDINLARQVARRDQRIQARESEIKNLEALLETKAGMKRAIEEKSARLSQELERMRAQLSKLQTTSDSKTSWWSNSVRSLDFDEDLYPHMLTAIAGRRWVIRHGLRLAMMKCAESLEMRQVFADVVSTELEGLKDAPMDVIMAALYLESDTGGDAPQFIRDLRPSSSQLAIPVSDGVLVSVPTVVPQGLALLLVDAATQTDLEDA
nr:hypothetical protein [Tanacetum cinerariifolium]